MGALNLRSYDSADTGHRFETAASGARSIHRDIAEIRVLTEQVEHGSDPQAHIEELTTRIKSLAHIIRHHLI